MQTLDRESGSNTSYKLALRVKNESMQMKCNQLPNHKKKQLREHWDESIHIFHDFSSSQLIDKLGKYLGRVLYEV